MSQATPTQFRGPTASTSSPSKLALVSEVPRGRPDCQSDSALCQRVHGLDQLSPVTVAHVRKCTVSTRYSERLVPGSKGLRGQQAVPGESVPCLRASLVLQIPGNSGLGPKCCGVDQLSRVSRARVRGPAGSTDGPG